MTELSHFRRTLRAVQDGREWAVRHLITEFEPHVRRAIRRRLPRRLRGKFDSDDFVQMVWASTFRDRQRFDKLAEPTDLLRYLRIVARNKLIQEMRKRLVSKAFNVTREQPAWRGGDPHLAAPGHSPSQMAIARERLLRLLKRLSERDRRIVWLRLHGASFVEIAKRFGLHERTVRKIVHGLTL
jgi:RNA polymerase sigma factor (sigma-70 family)